MCVLPKVLSSCKQEGDIEWAPSRANRFEPSSGLSNNLVPAVNLDLLSYVDKLYSSSSFDARHSFMQGPTRYLRLLEGYGANLVLTLLRNKAKPCMKDLSTFQSSDLSDQLDMRHCLLRWVG